ncbi:MAG: hypothetical protein JO159_12730 [Acidobacteria bacterium]|nr:hypothetical protein [Acidobacteriota bacterium]
MLLTHLYSYIIPVIRQYLRTPFERVCASPAADPERIAELKQQEQELDPFQSSRTIQSKLERIFQLSRELAGRSKTMAPVPTDTKREIVVKAKTGAKARRKSKTEKSATRSTKTRRRFAPYVSAKRACLVA